MPSDAGIQLLADLRHAVCSDGAPSARNLLVTLFGDCVAPHDVSAMIPVSVMSELLGPFGANERLIRTSLSRLANDEMLTVQSSGRRSFYGVHAAARELFATADQRIYGALHTAWDGQWTIVVLDGNESTAERRAELRAELSAAGLGIVAPNVMASPTVSAAEAARAVVRVGGLNNVLLTRSSVLECGATLGPSDLAARAIDLAEVTAQYDEFVARFGKYSVRSVAELDDALAFKLRVLLVSVYRRIVLDDPPLPAELLPTDWVGARARGLVAELYEACVVSGERHLIRVLAQAGVELSPTLTTGLGRFVTDR